MKNKTIRRYETLLEPLVCDLDELVELRLQEGWELHGHQYATVGVLSGGLRQQTYHQVVVKSEVVQSEVRWTEVADVVAGSGT